MKISAVRLYIGRVILTETDIIFFRRNTKSGTIILLLILFTLTSEAQSHRINNRTKIYAEEVSGDTIIIKADNDLSIPVTIQLSLDLENLVSDNPNTLSVVVEPKTNGKNLVVLYPKNPDYRFKYTYSWRVIPGDINKTPADYLYRFPYLKDAYYKISQGPFGSFSHQSMYAFDFLMPIGTPVCAARDGIVALVKNDSERGGADKKFIEDANFITVYHNDGTMANYCHLSKTGIKVKEGQVIKQGQVIALSGNTGFSNGPHLHFEVIRPNINTDIKQWVKFQWEPSTTKSALVINF